jgi:hypothetical protein
VAQPMGFPSSAKLREIIVRARMGRLLSKNSARVSYLERLGVVLGQGRRARPRGAFQGLAGFSGVGAHAGPEAIGNRSGRAREAIQELSTGWDWHSENEGRGAAQAKKGV